MVIRKFSPILPAIPCSILTGMPVGSCNTLNPTSETRYLRPVYKIPARRKSHPFPALLPSTFFLFLRPLHCSPSRPQLSQPFRFFFQILWNPRSKAYSDILSAWADVGPASIQNLADFLVVRHHALMTRSDCSWFRPPLPQAASPAGLELSCSASPDWSTQLYDDTEHLRPGATACPRPRLHRTQDTQVYGVR